jgi:hypothetical protein
MTTVFVAGSLSIKRLHPRFLECLDRIVISGFDVVVGDADGADTSIQQALLDRNASSVTVYCSGKIPRNNLGNWPVQRVATDREPGSRAFFTAKDLEMAKVADYGLMMWDAKSTGTLSNVIELLKRGRTTRVFVNKAQQLVTIGKVEDLTRLIASMSEGARTKAEQKMSLSRRVASLGQEQLALCDRPVTVTDSRGRFPGNEVVMERETTERRFGWILPKPHGHMDVTVMEHVLSQGEWKEFDRYTRVIEDLRPPMVDFLALKADYHAAAAVAEDGAASLDARFITGWIDMSTAVDAHANAQRHVGNFLSSASAFRDRTAARLINGAGDNKALDAFKRECSNIYDVSFGYRVLYNLRNHAQHFAPPIAIIPITGERTSTGLMAVRIELFLRPEILAQNAKLQSAVRNELAQLGEQRLPLKPLLDQYWDDHQRLMFFLIRSESTRLDEMASYAAHLYQAYKIPHEAIPVLWEGGDPSTGPESQHGAIPFRFDELERYLALRENLSRLQPTSPV